MTVHGGGGLVLRTRGPEGRIAGTEGRIPGVTV